MGLYNNYYFFCKSIPLSGIFIHLNLYNIMKRTIKTIFLALCYSAVTNGQTSTPIHLPAIFSDHMVLQQKSTVSIWGWGEASTTVKLVGSWIPNDTISTSVTADVGEQKFLPVGTEVRTPCKYSPTTEKKTK